MTARRVRAVVVAAVALALPAGGCTGDPPPRPAAPAPDAAPATYVAVGASESVGVGLADPLRHAWPQRLFRSAFPRSTVFVNMGTPGATVAAALDDQLPEAVRLEPVVATVWLNVNDLRARVPVDAYRRDLRALLEGLRRGGATRVLVANTPPLDHLPAYRACVEASTPREVAALCPGGERFPPPEELDAAVAAYNAAIAGVAGATGAVLVDLHAATMAARRAGTEASLVSSDGFHPSEAGQELVAAAFAGAMGAAAAGPG